MGQQELDARLNRLANIKSVGWVSLILFTALIYWLFVQIISTSLLLNSIESGDSHQVSSLSGINNLSSKIRLIYISVIIPFLFGLTASIGLIRFKNWGRIIFHIFSIFFLLVLFSALGFYIFNLYSSGVDISKFSMLAPADPFLSLQKFIIISYGILFLSIGWLIVRINLLLNRENYKSEFD